MNWAGCQQQQWINTFVFKQKGLENIKFCVHFPGYVTWLPSLDLPCIVSMQVRSKLNMEADYW
jgi:hypothetical protein